MGNSGYNEPINIARARCRTPGTKYGTDFTTKSIKLTIDLPVPMLLFSYGNVDEPKLRDDLHRAILPVMERVFRDRWSLLAGRKTERLGDKRMPKKWEEL